VPATLDDVAWPLTTARLTIRRTTPGDLPAIWRYRRLPEVSRWMTNLVEDEAAGLALLGADGRPERTLVVEHGGAVVGDLMVKLEDGWAQEEVAHAARGVQAEIGWAFHPDAQGLGLATEAARRLLALCFDELGLHRVVATCFAANAPSWRLMDRIGMRREAHLVGDALHRTDGWTDTFVYGLLDEEWARRA
jgi:predicted acetyltransferase